MTKNFQPSEDIFDDVEGHIQPGSEAEDAAVEGHAFRHVVREDGDDVEGHLGGKTVPVETEDNEKSWQR